MITDMKEEKLKLGRYTIGELTREWSDNENMKYKEYYKVFKNTDAVHAFFEYCRSIAALTNFGGNEYETNSFIEIKKDDITYSVQSPRAINGDDNWHRYSADYKKCCSIIVYKE